MDKDMNKSMDRDMASVGYLFCLISVRCYFVVVLMRC